MISESITSSLALRTCRHGLVLYRKNDKYLGRSIDEYGEFSTGEIEIFRRFITPDMTVIDAGSNIGIHTLEMSRLAKVVISFEAERLLHQMTCANIALNDRRNVIAMHTALGKEQGLLRIPNIDFDVDANFGCMKAQGHTGGDGVRMAPIDVFKINNCGFIKIDVEGMELEVLLGAKVTIERDRPILYVENDRKEKSSELIAHLLALGYKVYWHFPPLFSAGNWDKNEKNIFPGIASLNMLCFPDDREFAEGYHITSPDQWWEGLKVIYAKEIL